MEWLNLNIKSIIFYWVLYVIVIIVVGGELWLAFLEKENL